MTLKMLLFDIDGTLLLTGGAGKIAFERVFEEMFGVRDAWGETVPDGKTDPAIIREICDRVLGRELLRKEYRELCERYLRHFRTEIKKSARFRLMPGITELLASLSKRKDVFLGIATGNFEEAAWGKLQRGRIHRHFRFGGFGSDANDRFKITRQAMLRGRKLLGSPVPCRDVFVIGDTIHDVRAGKMLGGQTIAVMTGSTTRREFEAHSPGHVFRDLSDLDRFHRILDEHR